MRNFNYHQTTKIIFGKGRINELADVVMQYGKKVLLVTTPAAIPALHAQYEKVVKSLPTKEFRLHITMRYGRTLPLKQFQPGLKWPVISEPK
jgi:alcohol dehydrogenase YqhD (iron-dependent ADH family)